MPDNQDDMDKVAARGGRLAVSVVTAIQDRDHDQPASLLDSMTPEEIREALVASASILVGVLEVANREGFVSPAAYMRKYGLRMARFDDPDEET